MRRYETVVMRTEQRISEACCDRCGQDIPLHRREGEDVQVESELPLSWEMERKRFQLGFGRLIPAEHAVELCRRCWDEVVAFARTQRASAGPLNVTTAHDEAVRVLPDDPACEAKDREISPDLNGPRG